MSPYDDGLLLNIALRVLHAVTYLALGTLCGWWLMRRTMSRRNLPSPSPVTETPATAVPPITSREAEALLAQLYGLTTDVAHGVGEHSAFVAQVGRELNALADAGQARMATPVIQAIASVLHANKRLEEQLAHASQKMHEQVQQLEVQLADALSDPLTRIPNRRAFDRELARRLPECKRHDTPLALVMIDVDFFKKFNDTHGHQAGDHVLRGVAQVLRDTVREMDLPARIGGEEFAVVLPMVDLDQAQQVAERIRTNIEQQRFAIEGAMLQVTASIGVAALTQGDDADTLLKRADVALYASKKSGRNCGHYSDGSQVHPIPPETQSTVSGMRLDPAIERRLGERLHEAQARQRPLTLLLFDFAADSPLVAASPKLAVDLLTAALDGYTSAGDLILPISQSMVVVSLTGRDVASAVEMADTLYARLAQAHQQIDLPIQQFQPHLGFAEAAAHHDLPTLLDRAREALEASQQRGGLCIHFHTPQTRQPMLADLQPLVVP